MTTVPGASSKPCSATVNTMLSIAAGGKGRRVPCVRFPSCKVPSVKISQTSVQPRIKTKTNKTTLTTNTLGVSDLNRPKGGPAEPRGRTGGHGKGKGGLPRPACSSKLLHCFLCNCCLLFKCLLAHLGVLTATYTHRWEALLLSLGCWL